LTIDQLFQPQSDSVDFMMLSGSLAVPLPLQKSAHQSGSPTQLQPPFPPLPEQKSAQKFGSPTHEHARSPSSLRPVWKPVAF
jgi:hypothetical protein